MSASPSYLLCLFRSFITLSANTYLSVWFIPIPACSIVYLLYKNYNKYSLLCRLIHHKPSDKSAPNISLFKECKLRLYVLFCIVSIYVVLLYTHRYFFYMILENHYAFSNDWFRLSKVVVTQCQLKQVSVYSPVTNGYKKRR